MIAISRAAGLVFYLGAISAQAGSIYWVDPASPIPGIGSRDEPFRDLSAVLAHVPKGALVHLASGVYQGPFRLPGTTLEGTAGTVLTTPGVATVVMTSGEAHLARLTIQGGKVGLVSVALTELTDVTFRQQATSSIDVPTGTLRSTGLQVHGEPYSHALRVGPGARAEVKGARMWGTFHRAIQLEEGSALELTQTVIVGSEVALHGRVAQVNLRDVVMTGRRGPGIFLAGGVAHLVRVHVLGHEYSVLARSKARVWIEKLNSVSAERAGIAFVESQLTGSDIEIFDSGNLGALQAVGGQVTLDHFDICRAVAYGVIFVGTSGRLTDGRVSWVRRDQAGTAGEGLHFSRATAEGRSIRIHQAEGPCIVALEGSRMGFDKLSLEECGEVGMAVMSRSQVLATEVLVNNAGDAAATVEEQGELALDRWTIHSKAAEPGIHVDCEQKAVVWGGRMEAQKPTGLEVSCVRGFSARPASFGK